MSAVAVATLVLTGLLVAALAFYLIWVVLILRRIVATLGRVTPAARDMARRTEPIGAVVDGLNADLRLVAEALEARLT